jgi:cytochrome P450
MTAGLEHVDFAFDKMPGDELHEVLRAFRDEGPVVPTRFLGLPAFVIARYDALVEAFTDNERFPPHRMYQASFEGAIGRSFISEPDPARHRLYRKLATPAFRSRAVASYEREGLAAMAHELVDGFCDEPEIDLMAEFAARFPYLVITRLLGLPRDREEDFHGWAQGLLRFRDDPEQGRRAGEELTRFLAPVVEARRREPRNDVISELVQAEVEGRKLSDEEVFAHVRLLFPTGGETTHGSLGNLLYALFTQGDAWDRVRRDPARAEDAVEEALRWETPIAVLPRMSASHPVRFHGVDLPADSWVLFAIAGANRDPAVNPEPDRYDLDRAKRELLTFGRGVKSCPGSHLARRNMIVALQVLIERLPDLALIDAGKSRPRRTLLRCPDALHVRNPAARVLSSA